MVDLPTPQAWLSTNLSGFRPPLSPVTQTTATSAMAASVLKVSPNHAYPGTVHRLREFAATGRIQLREVVINDSAAVAAAAEGADLIWLETPTNPLMEVADIKAAVAVAKANNALVVVDNTFMSPVRQRPLDLGADVSMNSATKSIADPPKFSKVRNP